MQAIRNLQVALFGLFLMALGLNAGATSVFDPLTTAVDFSAVVTALFVVAASIMAVLVSIKGIKWIMAAVRGR